MSDFKLPFRGFGIAGPWGVGKTLMCLDLLVMAKVAGVSREEMVVLDTHSTVEPYLLLDRYKDVFTYEQCLLQDELRKKLGEIKKRGRKKILVVDTVEMLQTLLEEKVFDDPSNANKAERMPQLLWRRIKSQLLKEVLDLFVHYGETVIFTIHTSGEWVGKQPTGRLKAKFLDPIFQLCQSVAILSRRPNVLLPDANFFPPLGKSEFPALPPMIKEFSWNKFFSYVGKEPANWDGLKKDEMVTDGLELLDKIVKISEVNIGEEGEI